MRAPLMSPLVRSSPCQDIRTSTTGACSSTRQSTRDSSNQSDSTSEARSAAWPPTSISLAFSRSRSWVRLGILRKAMTCPLAGLGGPRRSKPVTNNALGIKVNCSAPFILSTSEHETFVVSQASLADRTVPLPSMSTLFPNRDDALLCSS